MPKPEMSLKDESKVIKLEQDFTTGVGEGLRYNTGKIQHDLLPAWAMNEVAKLFTAGAEKYAKHNWRKGMSWSTVIGSLKRHLNAFERGVDFDKEFLEKGDKIYHAAQIATNALFLLEYYRIFPQGDDRQHWYLNPPKIGLDIDDVLADWTTAWIRYHKLKVPSSWHFDRKIEDRLNAMKDAGTINDFYMKLKPKVKPEDIPFEPHCYITSRPVPTEISQEWLDKHGFPQRPVYTVPLFTSKIKVAKEAGIDIFVDDRFDNFVEFNKNNICCYLFTSVQNKRYDVGAKRIASLKELPYNAIL